MALPPNFSGLTPIDAMKGDDSDETELLRDMLLRAEEYLKSFSWCPPIVERFIGLGIGNVIALFLFRLEQSIHGTDEWLWVVEGDLPSAYFVVDDARDPGSALDIYCDLMDEWCEAVENNLSMNDVFPVGAAATKENAQMLRSRVSFLRERIVGNI